MKLNEAKQILNKSGYLLKEDKQTIISFKVVSATVDVYEDDYNEGEGKHYTSYTLDIAGEEFDNLDDLQKQLNDNLYSYDNPVVFGGEYKDGYLKLVGGLTVDENCLPADEDEIEDWKNGVKDLYSSIIEVKIRCCELTKMPSSTVKDMVEKSKYKIDLES